MSSFRSEKWRVGSPSYFELYIAFGGILFSILEDWSYMDAFYYSFISLTTIGFGDIVPENHDYIVIMLIYLGVGLSVTTMCIDLVGIQYIQKIHYFGRKFRGTDLLHLLKRKRMIERRLAMGQGEDILRMYVQHIEKEVEQMHKAEEEAPPPPPLIIKDIDNSMMRIDDSLSAFNLRFYDTYDEEDVFPPSCHSIRSFQPSIWSNSSARSYIYSQFQRQRGASWDESGPSLSDHCSLSTEPSVHIRQAFWDNYTSPTPSVTSFLHRHLYSPSVASTVSIDYENIAKASKQSTRSTSCPPIDVPSPRSHNSVSHHHHHHHHHPPTTTSPRGGGPSSVHRGPYSARGLPHPEHAFSPEPLLHSAPLSFRLPEPFMLSNLAAICDAFENDEDLESFYNSNTACLASKNYQGASLGHKRHQNPEGYDSAEAHRTTKHPTPFVPKLVLSPSPLPPKRLSVIDENKSATSPEPLLKRKHKERLARQQHPLHSFDWLNVSPRQFKPELLIRDDIPKLFKFVRNHSHNPEDTSGEKETLSCETITSQESVVLISPRSPIGLACMQDWDSYIQMLEEAAAEFQYPSEIIDEEELDEEEVEEDPEEELEEPEDEGSMSPTPLQTYISSDYVPPEIFTSSVITSPHRQLHFAPFIYYQPPPMDSELQYPTMMMISNNNSNRDPSQDQIEDDVLYEDEMEIGMPSPIPLEPQSSESEEEPVPVVVEEIKLKPQNDIDLGAFELVDSGLTPEALLSKDEPVIFHQSMPVHSVHHDTVQTEAALANLMAAPSSMLTNAIPPIMVEDNYCFVVDGERVRMGDILGDDQWWRHTSRPTKYFYSDDLKQFHRVNCITAKGKVITAKLATQLSHQPSTSSSLSASTSHHQNMSSSHHAQVHPQHHSMTNTPRSSISGGTFQTTHTTPSRGSSHHDANKVPLNNVYKVIRFYSFWKTCTSFHRIVTMIDKVVDEPSTTATGGNTFKKRLFVQYLWRNAKAVEKARVQKEFDPRRQRLLRFVTDPAARKRFVEDDLFAVIIDENDDNESVSEAEDYSDNEENINNIDPQRQRWKTRSEVTTHPGKGGQDIPVYSNDDEHPLDGPHTILHAVQCPKKLVATVAPFEVADTSCFVCDSNLVTMQMIEEDTDNKHWKQTMSTTHYYATDNWKDDFYRVNPLMCRGILRGAYRVNKDKSKKIQRIDIIKVYRVTRHFSCWKNVPIFHRVVSLVEAACPFHQLSTKQKQLLKANGKKLINRLFIQYYWRSQQSPSLRDQVLNEYAEASKKTRAKKSWIRVVKNVSRLRAATSLLAAARKQQEADAIAKKG